MDQDITSNNSKMDSMEVVIRAVEILHIVIKEQNSLIKEMINANTMVAPMMAQLMTSTAMRSSQREGDSESVKKNSPPVEQIQEMVRQHLAFNNSLPASSHPPI